MRLLCGLAAILLLDAYWYVHAQLLDIFVLVTDGGFGYVED